MKKTTKNKRCFCVEELKSNPFCPVHRASRKKEAQTESSPQTQMEPTPRPWFLTPRDTPKETRENFINSLCIESESGFVMRVSDLGHAKTEPQRRVDAEFILRAVNAHDDLLEACKKALVQYGEDIKDIGPCDHSVGICICGLIRDTEELEALIASVEGREACSVLAP